MIERSLPHRDFVAETRQWLSKTRDYGVAGAVAVQYLLDAKTGASVSAPAAALDKLYGAASAIPVVTGEGVFENFLLAADPSLRRYDVRLYAAGVG